VIFFTNRSRFVPQPPALSTAHRVNPCRARKWTFAAPFAGSQDSCSPDPLILNKATSYRAELGLPSRPSPTLRLSLSSFCRHAAPRREPFAGKPRSVPP
jgi:hypothetical protein